MATLCRGHTFWYIAPVRAKMPLNLSPTLRVLVDSAAFWRVRELYTGMCDPGISFYAGVIFFFFFFFFFFLKTP